MPLPKKPPTFKFDPEKVIQYAQEHFNDFDSALMYLDYVLTEMENKLEVLEKKFQVVKAEAKGKWGSDSSHWPEDVYNNWSEIGHQSDDLNECHNEIGRSLIEWARESLKGINWINRSTPDNRDDSLRIRRGKIRWCGTDNISLLGFIDLLERSGLIPKGSYKHAGSIAAGHFAHEYGSPISRKGINNYKDLYEANKCEVVDPLIRRLLEASKLLADDIR